MITTCNKCDMCTQRKHIVNGYGNINTDIMFIGEAPGYYEDKYGMPFIGKAGQELQKYLKLCNFDRQDIYITNTVKCKPPNNREPTIVEIMNCKEHLLDELRLVKPKIVILLGVTAFNSIFKYNYPSKVRSKWIPYGNTWFMFMYHPSYILRNPDKRIDYFRDFTKIVDKYRQQCDRFHSVNY